MPTLSDPQTKQTRKGNQWYFGMKAHIGVDAESGLVHSVVGTSANVSDVTQAGALLHGEEEAAFGDAGYRGVNKRPDAQGPTWHVAMPGTERRTLNPFAISPSHSSELLNATLCRSALAGKKGQRGKPCGGVEIEGDLDGAGDIATAYPKV